MSAVLAQRLRFLWAKEFHDEDRPDERIAASDPCALVECLHCDLSGGAAGHDGNIRTPEEGFDAILYSSFRALNPRSVAQGLRFIGAWELPLVSTGQGSDELDRVLANNDVFAQATRILLPIPPDQGLYCSILIWAHHSALGNWLYSTPVESGSKEEAIAQTAKFSLLLPLALLLQSATTIFHWWSSGAGYTVEYILYIDGKRERSYSYEITKKGVGWIVLLPVAWINFFTQDAKDAFRATAYQFFRDADRDGYLGGK